MIGLRSNWISLNRYGSKIRKVSRCKPAVSNKTTVATRPEFTKVASVQSIAYTVLLNFWLMLLSWMFISSYTTIYFFIKKFIFSNVYISRNAIFECLNMFLGWERGNQLSTNATDREMGSSKMRRTAYRRRDVTPRIYVCTHSFHVFGSIFVL